MNNKSKMTREEFERLFFDLPADTKSLLWDIFMGVPSTSLQINDYSAECSMCGKDMAYRECGMCPHCEMVWNS